MNTTCDLYTSIAEIRSRVRRERASGKRIGYLATMGALHEGHLSLARTLDVHSDFRVCSVFVNPTQFNDPRDYEAYTISVADDRAALASIGVDALFAPSREEMYRVGFDTIVRVGGVSVPFEGEFRPGHFDGVASVVAMLFNIVKPDVTIFGEKDFQQLRLIEQLVGDLQFDIEVIRGALVRDPSGLALSSRNARLSPAGKSSALSISRALFAAREAYRVGERRTAVLEELVTSMIQSGGAEKIDYVAAVNEATLARPELLDDACRILVVAHFEGVRLLDNVALRP